MLLTKGGGRLGFNGLSKNANQRIIPMRFIRIGEGGDGDRGFWPTDPPGIATSIPLAPARTDAGSIFGLRLRPVCR